MSRSSGSIATPAALPIERYLIAYDIGRAVNPMLVEGPDRRRLRAGAGRRAVRGVPLRRTRRAARDHLRRLSDADAHEVPRSTCCSPRTAPAPLNPLGIKGAGEGGITARRRGDRLGHRRRHRHPGRDHPAAGHAAAAQGAVARARHYSGLIFAVWITLAHVAVCAAMNVPNSAADIGVGTKPRSLSRALMVGSASAALTLSLR